MTQEAKSFVRLAVEAMKCRFELVLAGDEPARLRAVGEEALEEIERLGRNLNFYWPSSLLSRLNRDASAIGVPVDARLYQLLTLCRDVHRRTGGAFDPTISPLLETWGFFRRRGRRPSDSELDEALQRVGFDKVLLDDDNRTLRLTGGATLNLSSVAKGYALDCAAEILREHGIQSALLHGGTSSVLALGNRLRGAEEWDGEALPEGDSDNSRVLSERDSGRSQPDAASPSRAARPASGWTIEVADPRDEDGRLLRWTLHDEAMSVSGNHLNVLRVAEKTRPDGPKTDSEADGYDGGAVATARIGHVIDPRNGRPAESILLASVTVDGATSLPAALADAYATAALVDSAEEPTWRNEVQRLHRATD